jgi:CDP-glycerol glycerophosphotransferase (TagB/SpsB family)
MVSPFEFRQFYWLSNPYFSSLDEKIFKELPDDDSVVFAEKYFQKINEEANVKPFYASDLASRYNFFMFIKWLALLFLKMIRSGFNYKMNRYLKSYYCDNTAYKTKLVNYVNSILHSYKRINNNFEIVFYPLHYEPEASILYMSEYYEDQIGLIRNLAKCLKNNQLLVVKEHPQQPGMLLSKSYGQLRKRLSNVAFLPAEYSTKKIILLSELVITQTSTAGWEALILGKPVIVIGKVFYDKYPKINIFSDFENLKIMIHSKQYQIPQKDDTLKFIAQVWNYCQEGNPYPAAELYNQENIKRIVHSIEQRLITL